MGEISKLNSYALTPLPAVDTTSLNPVKLERIDDFTTRLRRAWAPVERGDDFLWRDLVENQTSSAIETD